MEAEQPPLARILRVSSQGVEVEEGAKGFVIKKSSGGVGHHILISPDTAICPECQAELFDKTNQRFLYPFINCTNCGPRFTITRSVPYDRPNTSMEADALAGLKDLRAQGRRFGLASVDPPAFVKRKKDMEKGLAAYRTANRLALELVEDGGFLLACSCSQPVGRDDLRKVLAGAARDAGVRLLRGLGMEITDSIRLLDGSRA